MTTQPRQPVGTRRGDVSVAGRWASKPVPGINPEPVGFNDGVVGEPDGCDRFDVQIYGLQTTFTRTVETDETGTKVVSVTTDCDDPTMVLLARKGDAGYWSDGWGDDVEVCRLWSADICRQMLQEGLVSTWYGDGVEPIYTAMTAAINDELQNDRFGKHVFTYVIAQLRGLRLLQSMAPADGWDTKFADRAIPISVTGLFDDRFEDMLRVYAALPSPPWDTTGPPHTLRLGPRVAGQATTYDSAEVFVGENGDLVWRAVTETEQGGLSPLKVGILHRDPINNSDAAGRMCVAAVLYDELAEKQLTSDLFVGIEPVSNRRVVRECTLQTFADALNPTEGECRWTPEQQHRIRGFIKTVEGLEP